MLRSLAKIRMISQRERQMVRSTSDAPAPRTVPRYATEYPTHYPAALRAIAKVSPKQQSPNRRDLSRVVVMSEAIETRLLRARSWLRKARKAAENADLDAQFVFLWIAFNALYGMPRYRRSHDDTYIGEAKDFLAFLDDAERLARGRFDACLARVKLMSARFY